MIVEYFTVLGVVTHLLIGSGIGLMLSASLKLDTTPWIIILLMIAAVAVVWPFVLLFCVFIPRKR